MLLAEVGISVLIICKFSNKWTCTRKKEVEGLSCGFEDNLFYITSVRDTKIRTFFGIEGTKETEYLEIQIKNP